jgi:hypothetical protein
MMNCTNICKGKKRIIFIIYRSTDAKAINQQGEILLGKIQTIILIEFFKLPHARKNI